MFRLLEIVIYLGLLLPILYVSSLFHELGHAIMGRCAGYIVTTFGMGLGKPLLKLRVAGMHVYLANQSPFQGLTLMFDPRLVSRPVQAAAFCLGGVIANLLLVPLALLGWFFWPLEHGGVLWLLAAAVNLVNSVLNLIPFRMRVGQATVMTDGAVLLYTLCRPVSRGTGEYNRDGPFIARAAAGYRGSPVAHRLFAGRCNGLAVARQHDSGRGMLCRCGGIRW